MKNIITLALLAACLVAGYFVVSPFLALEGLSDSIEDGDVAALEDRVDFPSVREGLKAEINAMMMDEVGPNVSDNPLGVLAVGLASRVVDGLVDVAVTPAGLARLASGETPSVPSPEPREQRRRESRRESPRDSRGGSPSNAEPELFEGARFDRETLSRFSVWVPDDDGDEIRFVFRRRGIRWVLTSVEFPVLRAARTARP